MKKVAIITIYDKKNYGNRLQNYALQELIKSIGAEAYTIKNVEYVEYKYTFSKHHLRRVFGLMKRENNEKKKLDKHRLMIDKLEHTFKDNLNRYDNFNRFDDLIRYDLEWLSEHHLKLSTEYDCYCSGSDQVFNYKYGRANRIDFLDFAPNDKKKIAYSASIGVKEIPLKVIFKYKHYLGKFDYISVREKQAKIVFDKLHLNKEVVIMVDPTMTLEKSKWMELADRADIKLPNKYVVTLFLGNNFIQELIENYAINNNCEIITLNDRDNQWYSAGPFEFLQLIRNADMVFSDSYHACVFSLIFHTDFYAIKRSGDDETIFSRIEWLLSQFQLENRILNDNTFIERIDEEVFLKVDQRICYEMECAKKFMKEAIF